MSYISNEDFPTSEGLGRLLIYLDEHPSIEGYLYVFNNFDLDDTLRAIVSEQIEDACLLDEIEEDLFEAGEDALELYFFVNYPPNQSGAYEMVDFLYDHDQFINAWEFFERYHLQFLTVCEKKSMLRLKSKVFDFDMYEEEFKTSILDLITALYLEDVESQATIHPISISFIIDHIAAHFGASSDDIISKKRDSLFARYACIYILVELREFTMEEIAKALDFTLVSRVHEIFNQVHEFYNLNRDFKDRIDTLMEEIDEFFDVV